MNSCLRTASLAAALLWAAPAFAAPVTYYFGGFINFVEADHCAAGRCNPALIGTGTSALGTRISGQYTFDTEWAAIPGNGQATYRSANNSPDYIAIIDAAGVTFTFKGVIFEVSHHEFNPHYSVSSFSALADSASVGDQSLALGYWGFGLQFGLPDWGDGTLNIPTTPPLLSQFASTTFAMGVYSSLNPDIGHQYRGVIDYLGASPAPVPAPVPVPSALPLFATGLGLLGWLGWRRKGRAALAA